LSADAHWLLILFLPSFLGATIAMAGFSSTSLAPKASDELAVKKVSSSKGIDRVRPRPRLSDNKSSCETTANSAVLSKGEEKNDGELNYADSTSTTGEALSCTIATGGQEDEAEAVPYRQREGRYKNLRSTYCAGDSVSQ
jgi:hypothetical protein